MDGILLCNYKRCQTKLTSEAWITSCSHIFCSEHCPTSNESIRKCPFCSSDLRGKNNINKRNLNPSEEFKTVVVAGFSPNDILDMGFKALEFLKLQTMQQKMFMSSHLKHQCVKLAQIEVQFANSERTYQDTINKLKSLIQRETQNCENLQKGLNCYIKKTQLLEEEIRYKNRQLHKTLIKNENSERDSSRPNDWVKQQTNMFRGSSNLENGMGNPNRNQFSCSQQTPSRFDRLFSPVNNQRRSGGYDGRMNFSQNF